MAGNLEGRLNKAESEFAAEAADFIDLEDGRHVYVGAMQIVDDFIDLLHGEDIPDDRARLYADALDDPHHGSMMHTLIFNCQERYREES